MLKVTLKYTVNFLDTKMKKSHKNSTNTVGHS